MKSNDDTVERTHVLWDELADYDAASGDEAIDHLLASLCALVDAQNANWVGAVRLSDIVPDDPLKGWRPRVIRFLHPSQPLDDAGREQTRKLAHGTIDITTIRNVALCGRFRANRLVDLAGEDWFESDYYRRYYRDVGRGDAIWAGCPVNADAEVYFGIFRDRQQPRFSPPDCATVAYALRGIKWFHRRQMLSHGLLVASAPLTQVERSVLQGLLTGQSEKQIAAALGRSYHTTHEYVTVLFRKFDVNNRAALMALWLGKTA